MYKAKDISADILIIGAGPAGLSAAIYAARAGRKTVVLKGKARSHLAMAHKVENYPGFEALSGNELLEKMENHAKRFGAEILSGDALTLGLGSDPKMVSTRNEFITANAVILAMGKGEHRKSVPNEERFLGTGISYCAVCDGAFYRNRDVVVYGSDHEAVDDAQMLQQLGCRTTLVLYCRESNCPEDLVDAARSKGVHVLTDTEITDVAGTSAVERVTIRNAEGERTLSADGLFLIHAVPSVTILRSAGVNLTNKDCIAVNRDMETSIPGVFAAGDITCGGMQVVTAAGDGAVAALSASRYIRGLKQPVDQES